LNEAPRGMRAMPNTPRSLWRWTQLSGLDLRVAIAGDQPLESKRARRVVAELRTRERPRRRHRTHAERTLRKIASATEPLQAIAA
jgi:hypothetical protein